MSAEQYYWREFVLVVGGVALIAWAQAQFIGSTNASHIIWAWIVSLPADGRALCTC